MKRPRASRHPQLHALAQLAKTRRAAAKNLDALLAREASG